MTHLEDVLGRKLQESELGSVPTLNDLSRSQVDEAQKLLRASRLLAVDYLCDVVAGCNLSHAARFLEQALEPGVDVATWGRRDELCVPAAEPGPMLSRTVDETLATVAEVNGERWRRMVPSMEVWQEFPFCGAPAVIARSVPYWWSTPDLVESLTMEDETLEPVGDLSIAVRRWVASCIAWRTQKVVGVASMEQVLSALRVSVTPSADAQIALRGLLMERVDGSNLDRAPGFRGPDEWYA